MSKNESIFPFQYVHAQRAELGSSEQMQVQHRKRDIFDNRATGADRICCSTGVAEVVDAMHICTLVFLIDVLEQLSMLFKF